MVYAKPKNGREKKVRSYEEREIRSSLLILDFKDGKLQNSGKQGGKAIHKFHVHVLGINDGFWDRVMG